MIQRSHQIRIERLEDRQMLATYVVDSNLDVIDANDGVLTLREALTAANASPDEDDVIAFAESSYGTILLTNGFLSIEDAVAINGPGADLITIDASGNDPTPLVDDGRGSQVFYIDFDLDFEDFPVVDIVGLALTGGDAVGGDGGAIYVSFFFGGHLRIRDSIIRDNFSTFRGGAIFNDEGQSSVTIENVWIDGNTSSSDGGAIFSRGDLEVINSTLSNNVSVNGDGGAIDRRRIIAITGSTISGNTAGGAGGGLHLAGSFNSVTIKQSTIANNTADGGINGIQLRGTPVVIEDSILGNGQNINLGRNSNPLRNSLLDTNIGTRISPTDGGTDEFGNIIGSAANVADPLLGPLANHGGIGPTHALLADSPAINLGNPDFIVGSVLLDQRDAPRLSGGRLDAGAYEYQFPVVGVDLSGDDANGCHDIDLIAAAILMDSNVAAYDLTMDGQVAHDDLSEWLTLAGFEHTSAAPFRSGDANLDGVVDGTDHGIWSDNRFSNEFSWCRGDFNTDGVVDGSDFNAWNANRFTEGRSQGNGVSTPPRAVLRFHSPPAQRYARHEGIAIPSEGRDIVRSTAGYAPTESQRVPLTTLHGVSRGPAVSSRVVVRHRLSIRAEPTVDVIPSEIVDQLFDGLGRRGGDMNTFPRKID